MREEKDGAFDDRPMSSAGYDDRPARVLRSVEAVRKFQNETEARDWEDYSLLTYQIPYNTVEDWEAMRLHEAAREAIDLIVDMAEDNVEPGSLRNSTKKLREHIFVPHDCTPRVSKSPPPSKQPRPATPFRCESCGRSFKNKMHLRVHSRVHETGKNTPTTPRDENKPALPITARYSPRQPTKTADRLCSTSPVDSLTEQVTQQQISQPEFSYPTAVSSPAVITPPPATTDDEPPEVNVPSMERVWELVMANTDSDQAMHGVMEAMGAAGHRDIISLSRSLAPGGALDTTNKPSNAPAAADVLKESVLEKNSSGALTMLEAGAAMTTMRGLTMPGGRSHQGLGAVSVTPAIDYAQKNWPQLWDRYVTKLRSRGHHLSLEQLERAAVKFVQSREMAQKKQ